MITISIKMTKYTFEVYRYPKKNVKQIHHIKTYHSDNIKKSLLSVRLFNYRFKQFRYTVKVIKNDN